MTARDAAANAAMKAPAGAAVAAFLAELIDALDPGAEIRYRRALCREAYERGRAKGWQQGYERAHAEMERDWHAIADPASRSGTSYAELEARRYGPGGREHFGDLRPGDYTPRRRVA